ncbi:glycosyltransferase family 8 protein [Niallia sp. 01092]|uniref:glycosyltransferase family 8 protein n=1 Tax=unclassified Niallia TaxID=2837522 RepID=UPI003FD2BCD3
MEEIHIVTSTSNKFAKHAAVMIYSLLKNIRLENKINIYILTSNMSHKKRQKLHRVADSFNGTLHFLKVDKKKYAECKKGRRITDEAYFRLSIPDLLNQTIEKVIYLDSDLIVQEDIANLWNTPINHYLLAAVQDPGAKKYGRYKALSIPVQAGYFNSGVMVLNVKKWRELNISEKVIAYIKDNPEKIRLLDQDGLNAILYNNWLPLDPKWNYQTAHIGKLLIEPSIIHYTTGKKPWKHEHPLGHFYYYYSSKTQWDVPI